MFVLALILIPIRGHDELARHPGHVPEQQMFAPNLEELVLTLLCQKKKTQWQQPASKEKRKPNRARVVEWNMKSGLV